MELCYNLKLCGCLISKPRLHSSHMKELEYYLKQIPQNLMDCDSLLKQYVDRIERGTAATKISRGLSIEEEFDTERINGRGI